MAIIELNSFKSASGRLNALVLLLLFSLPLGQMALSNLLLILLLLQSLILFRKKDWAGVFHDSFFWPSALFFIYMALSLSWSTNPENGLSQLETKTSFLLVPLFLIAGKRHWDPALRDKALKVFWWGNLLAVAIALLYASYRSIQTGAFYETNAFGRRYYFLYTHLASPLMHPGYVGTFVGMAILSALFLQQKADRMGKRIYWASIGLFILFMILLQARINLIALFFVLGLAALVQAIMSRNYKLLSLPVGAVILLGTMVLLAPESLKKRYLQVPDFSYDISGEDFNSATYRLAEWKSAVHAIDKKPWFGNGLGGNSEALNEAYHDLKFWEGLKKGFNAHNQYLETMLATGLIGLLLLLYLIGNYAYHAWRQRDYLILLNVLFFAICLSTESMFERIWAVLLFTIFFTLMNLKEYGSSGD